LLQTGPSHPSVQEEGEKRVEPASYRPVSLLPAASKILELLVKEDLEKHLAAVDGLPPSQFGFRPGRSTVTALAAAHAAWLAASRSGEAVGIWAFNLSAAFDTVSTDQLLPKLGALGVNGRALEWFGNYLSGGRQAVVWESSTSDFIQINHGMRQGSLLGPLLFLALVSDMPRYVGDIALTSYADNTCL
jgi:hypothetical protein